MFSKVVILLALVAIAFVHGLDEKLILQLKNKHNAIKNAKASGKKIQVSAVRDQSVATSYVVVSTYPDGSLCEGTPDLTMGLAVDTCIIGEVDYTTGTPQSSIKYYKDALGQVFMSYYSEAADCTGTFSDTQVNVPTPCINGNMKVTYQESSEPWTGNNADGVVIEFFDTGDHCGEGGSGYDFIWYANNYCIPDAAEDGSYQSYQYSDCADGYILVHYYTDAKCTNALTTTPVSLSSCMETTNNLQPAWITQACSFVDNSASGNSAV